MYTGKIVLKGILCNELYQHFLVLNVAIGILVSPRLTEQHAQYVHKLLKYYVIKSRELYGDEFLVYNIHSLLHLTRDAELQGGLDQCSAFPFENYLQRLKKMVRSGNNPLVQIVKRHREIQRGNRAPCMIPDSVQFKRPNNAYILNDVSCCEISADSLKVDDEGKKLYVCRVYDNALPLFMLPCNSCLIGALTILHQNSYIKLLPLRLLTKKAMLIECNPRKSIFLAILHAF